MLIVWIICAEVMGFLIGAVTGGYYMGHKYCLRLEEAGRQKDRLRSIIQLYDNWMMVKKNSVGIAEYLNSKGIHNVAIYGMDYRGIRLFHELQDTCVNVKYGIDRNLKARIMGLNICRPDEIKKEEVDAVIITALFSFEEIRKNLEDKGFTQIMGLDDIIYDLLQA